MLKCSKAKLIFSFRNRKNKKQQQKKEIEDLFSNENHTRIRLVN